MMVFSGWMTSQFTATLLVPKSGHGQCEHDPDRVFLVEFGCNWRDSTRSYINLKILSRGEGAAGENFYTSLDILLRATSTWIIVSEDFFQARMFFVRGGCFFRFPFYRFDTLRSTLRSLSAQGVHQNSVEAEFGFGRGRCLLCFLDEIFFESICNALFWTSFRCQIVLLTENYWISKLLDFFQSANDSFFPEKLSLGAFDALCFLSRLAMSEWRRDKYQSLMQHSPCYQVFMLLPYTELWIARNR